MCENQRQNKIRRRAPQAPLTHFNYYIICMISPLLCCNLSKSRSFLTAISTKYSVHTIHKHLVGSLVVNTVKRVQCDTCVIHFTALSDFNFHSPLSNFNVFVLCNPTPCLLQTTCSLPGMSVDRFDCTIQ